MKVANAIKKLEKAGFTVSNDGFSYWAKKGNRIVSFINQEDYVICINARREDDVSDSMTDYHAGIFCDNITRAIKLSN